MILFFTAFGSISLVYAGGSGLATTVENNLENIFDNFSQAIDAQYPDHAVQITLYTKVRKRITELAQEADGTKKLILNYIGDLFYNKVVSLNDNENTDETIKNIYITAIDGSSIAQNLTTETFGCNDKIFPIQQTSLMTPEAAIQTLFNYRVATPMYTDYAETYNVFANSALTIESLTIENWLATLKLTGTLSVGGICDSPRVSEQIKQTLLQYPEINEVNILINDEDLSSFLSEKDEEVQNDPFDLTNVYFNGVGSEPFWSFSTDGYTIEWRQPGAVDTEITHYAISATTNNDDIHIVNEENTLSITLTNQTCIGDMNGFTYDYTVHVTKGDTQLQGCANKE